MSDHTKEPWSISHRNKKGIEIQGANGDGVCLSHDDGGNFDVVDANRIVACVNACTGISNDVLDAGAIVESDKLYAADKALGAAIRQRDELLAALELIRGAAQNAVSFRELQVVAAQAIAKAEAQS